MKTCVMRAQVLVVLMVGGCTAQGLGTGKSNEGVVNIFDGKSLDGWTAYAESGRAIPLNQSGFEVRGNCIHLTGKRTAYWLAYKEEYGDFDLHLECKLTEKANSGIFVRCPGPDLPSDKGFEVQILDTYGKEPNKTSCGSIYDVITPMRNMVSPPGEWNKVEVTCRGSYVIIFWNGFKIIDVDFNQLTQIIGGWKMAYVDKPRNGLIGLQSHGSELWFRNITIRKL
jgi:hypothetical protein